MSKQLTISATASVLAMALFAVSTGTGDLTRSGGRITGAKTMEVSAPAWDRLLPSLPAIR